MRELVLYHHPFSRAASVVWMLEEIGQPYRLEYVDFAANQQKGPELRALNPMGKIPILVDGEAVITETAAIGLYLADRYALGRLAPALDSPDRGLYLRSLFFPSAVMEPSALAQLRGWEVPASQAGFGDHASMLATLDALIGKGPYILGDTFSMADMVLGASLRYMLRFKMVEATPHRFGYAERLGHRPALVAADAKNAEIINARGLGR